MGCKPRCFHIFNSPRQLGHVSPHTTRLSSCSDNSGHNTLVRIYVTLRKAGEQVINHEYKSNLVVAHLRSNIALLLRYSDNWQTRVFPSDGKGPL